MLCATHPLSNPIEKLERSLLIIASTILDLPAQQLIKPEHVGAISTHSAPRLFLEDVRPASQVTSSLEKGKDKEKV